MDDLISRQAAIDAIVTEGTRLERNGTVAMVEIKQWCVDLLEALPSAQRCINPNVSGCVGHWVWEKPSDDFRCSNCGNIADQKYPYCPNCGARMDEVMKDE